MQLSGLAREIDVANARADALNRENAGLRDEVERLRAVLLVYRGARAG